MVNILTAEFIKLKRSKTLLIISTAAILPNLILLFQNVLNSNRKLLNWDNLIMSSQELSVFALMCAVILTASHVFAFENSNNTLSNIFTSPVSKTKLVIIKMLVIFVLIFLLILLWSISKIITGIIICQNNISTGLLTSFLQASGLMFISYFSVSGIIVLISVVIKKYALSVAIVFSYIVFVFPFHLKNNLFICPLMIPTVLYAKILGAKDLIGKNYFYTVNLNYFSITVLLIIFFCIPLALIAFYYKKADVY